MKALYGQLIVKADKWFVALCRPENAAEEILMKTLDNKIKDIGPTRRKKVETRAAALSAEENAVRETPGDPKTQPKCGWQTDAWDRITSTAGREIFKKLMLDMVGKRDY